jgi:hypothetical protein
MSVFFRAEDHSYKSVNSEDNIKWISVTSFVSKFKEKFDPIAVSQKASKNKKSVLSYFKYKQLIVSLPFYFL